MSKVVIGDPILVHAPCMNEAIACWGVYAIPRMWREPDGTLVVRFNGEEDSVDVANMQKAPNLYFISRDDGQTWQPSEKEYDISVLTGIDPPYFHLKSGEVAFLQSNPHVKPIHDTAYRKEFICGLGDAEVRVYRYGDLPADCKEIRFGRYNPQTGKTVTEEIDMGFPEREVLINSKANVNGTFVPVEEHIQPFIFKLPYFSAVRELEDSTLVAVCAGQNPEVYDRYYTEVYLIASEDGGRTWKKRATIAGGVDPALPFGYGGDGWELSLALDATGSLYCVMRMDMSRDPDVYPDPSGVVLCISRDGGYTWSEPRMITDSSVTPHIIPLGEDALVLIYGRPGVHCKFSFDQGETWSEPYSIIGKTLTEERADGRSDFESKYGDSVSYSNTFWERLQDGSVLLLYNDQRYLDENGVPTKAAFVRRIAVE